MESESKLNEIAASQAEIKAENNMTNDAILSELQEIITRYSPGDKVSVGIIRDKKPKTIDVTLKNGQGNTKVVKQADMDVLGADVRPITNQQKEQLSITYGLEVIKVNSGKLKDAGIAKGFIIQKVNDETMKTVEDLQQAVKEASTSKEPVLIIRGLYPTGKKAYFIVELQ